ncbi:MAG TPA: S41 family peptidase [Stellaceae bacterium]|nr:S41 family peptidase [Stellaceae bacterium]
MPMSLRPAEALVPAVLILLLSVLGGCAQQQPLPADPTGRLFGRALDDISDFYIAPVSSRRLALAATARLGELDPQLAVWETPGPGDSTELTLDYRGREVTTYPNPKHDDPHVWGGWLGHVVADAKNASPTLAGTPDDEIDEALFDGITGALDRFSRYASPAAAREHRAARDGFGGIGVTLDPSPDRFQIVKLTPGAPADLAGIRVGDTIVAIDGRPTAGWARSDVVDALRGPVLSPVAVTVERPGTPGPHQYQLQRVLIVEPTVTVSDSGGVAVFHISSFNQDTTQQLVADLRAAERGPGPALRGVVLDLRGDPGGLLDQAVSLADVFIAKGPIVATIGRNPAARQFFEASGDSVAPTIPIVVLVNGGSASASEIVAASLQDAGRAVVVGTASYGKGTVQTVLRLPNHGELTLTWALLVAPAGYLLNTHGVVPTVCTSDLGDDPAALQTALARAGGAAVPSPLTDRPRATLDNADWLRLRASCPPRLGDRAIDLAVAERLLADPQLYSQAVHAIAGTASLAARPQRPSTAADPVLTGAALTAKPGALFLQPPHP